MGGKGLRTQSHRRYEVWVTNNAVGSDEPGGLRFNAGFITITEALDECEWYHQHGYRALVVDNKDPTYDKQLDTKFIKVWWKEYFKVIK